MERIVRCRVGGWEVDTVPGTAYTIGPDGEPQRVNEALIGKDGEAVGITYAVPVEPVGEVIAEGTIGGIKYSLIYDFSALSQIDVVRGDGKIVGSYSTAGLDFESYAAARHAAETIFKALVSKEG